MTSCVLFGTSWRTHDPSRRQLTPYVSLSPNYASRRIKEIPQYVTVLGGGNWRVAEERRRCRTRMRLESSDLTVVLTGPVVADSLLGIKSGWLCDESVRQLLG